MSTPVELPPQARAWLDVLREARSVKKSAEADEALAKRNLLDLLGEADEGQIDGTPALVRTVSVRQTVNSDQLKTEYPQVYEAVLRTSAVTTLRLPGDKK